MISSLNINNFGIFNDFQWKRDVDSVKTFKKLNIIYGRNYSGKTSLARLLRCFEKEDLAEKYENCQFNILLNNNRITLDQTQIKLTEHQLKIRVYNTDFVKDNLSWLDNHKTGDILPFVLIGEKNIEIEEKIKIIDMELGALETDGLRFDLSLQKLKIDNEKTALKTKNNVLDKSLIQEAKNIKENHQMYGNNITYDKSNLKNDILKFNNSNVLNMKLSETEIDNLRSIIDETPKEEINLLSIKLPNFEKVCGEVSELLKTVTKPSAIIQELAEYPELHKWVENGISLHKTKRKNCGFCGNELTQSLWNKLDSHFIKENENLTTRINNKIQELTKISEQNSIPFNKEDLYQALQIEFTETNNRWTKLCKSYTSNIQELVKVLEKKSTNIFNKFELPSYVDISNDMLLAVENFNALVNNHNKKSKNISQDKKAASEKLKLSRIANYLINNRYFTCKDEIVELEKSINNNQRIFDEINNKIKKLELEKIQLESQIKDSEKAVSLVNKYLNKFFNCHISLKTNDGNKSFIIIRDDHVAHNLSEGERNLIAFCYFIAKLEDELNDEKNLNKLIIYIDDPISSLDNNHIFFTYSLIESILAKDKKYGQLFISTHNLEFLKYLKRLTQDHKDVAYYVIERHSKSNTKLKLMPDYMKNYVTEFNYLFHQLYQCAYDNQYDLKHVHYNFGNNLRKFPGQTLIKLTQKN